MPLYEYECQKCGKHFEKIEKLQGPYLKKCPNCGGRVERLMSPPAIQFKGSGWYVTDYGGKGAAPKSSGEGSGDGGAAKAAEKNSGSKTDSKSDSKSESKPAASDNSNKGAAKRKR